MLARARGTGNFHSMSIFRTCARVCAYVWYPELEMTLTRFTRIVHLSFNVNRHNFKQVQQL